MPTQQFKVQWKPAAAPRSERVTLHSPTKCVLLSGGIYAAENDNAAALRKFGFEITDLGESTLRLFKKQYLEEIRKA